MILATLDARVDVLHHHVAQDGVGLDPAESLEALHPAQRDLGREAVGVEHGFDGFADVRVIVDDQDLRLVGHVTLRSVL